MQHAKIQMGPLEPTLTGAFRKLKLSTTQSLHEVSQCLTLSLNPVLLSMADKGARAAACAEGTTIFQQVLLKLEQMVISDVYE